MKTPLNAILIVLLGLAPLATAQDEPADANATADVTEQPQPQPVADEAEPPVDKLADPVVPDTVQQMQIIEALPVYVPDNAEDEAVDPAPPVPGGVKAALRNRMNDLLAEPTPTARGEAVQAQLVELTNNASQLALLTDPGPEQFEALSVQMQALYAQITETVDPSQVDRLLSRLRSAARRTKAINLPQAPSVGDFWLMTAELFDLNRTPLSVEARRKQAAALMAEYLEDYPEAGPSESVRSAYVELQKARGLVEEVRPIIRSADEVRKHVGKEVVLRGKVTNTKIPQIHGVDVQSEDPDLRGKEADVRGVLRRYDELTELLDGQIIQHRGGGERIEIVDPKTGQRARVTPVGAWNFNEPAKPMDTFGTRRPEVNAVEGGQEQPEDGATQSADQSEAEATTAETQEDAPVKPDEAPQP